MRGSVTHRNQPGCSGSWSYRLDIGNEPARRCEACLEAKRRPSRWWADNVHQLDVCPTCGGELVDIVARRERVVAGFATKRDAQAALNAELTRQRGETNVAPSKLTVRQFLEDEWLPSLASNVRPSTLSSYRGNVRNYLVPALGSIPLQKLNGDHIRAMYAALLNQPKRGREGARPLSASTVRLVGVILHRAMSDAVEWHRRTTNPCAAAKLPKAKRVAESSYSVWTGGELATFLAETGEMRLGPLWRVYSMTGLRRGEGCGLRWSDVDLENGRLSVQQALVPYNGEVIVSEPKTDAARRLIALDAKTVGVLREQARRQLADHELAGDVWRDSGYVFTTEDGEPLNPDRVSRAFNAAVHDTIMSRIRLHDLRHTHATLMLQAGVHPRVVQQRLGHSSIVITLGTYSHVIKGMDEAAAEAMAALVVTPAEPR
jgi:integrase